MSKLILSILPIVLFMACAAVPDRQAETLQTEGEHMDSTQNNTQNSIEADESGAAGEPVFHSEELSMDTGSGILKGTLSIPAGDGPFPAALIIAGSGPTDRDGNSPLIPGQNNSLKMIAEALADAGIASLRTDKRGIAESASAMVSESDLRFSTYIDDYVMWFNTLLQDSRIDSAGIIGHSEGSLIGLAAALETDAAFVINLAGIGEAAYITLERQLMAQSPAAAGVAVEIMNTLRTGELVEEIPEGFESLFRPSVQPYLVSWFSYDPVKLIAELKVPVMIIQGTTDLQVRVEDAEMLHKGNPDAELLIIEGMNHVLKNAPADQAANIAAYSDPDLPLAEGLMEAVITFIQTADR